MLGHLPTPVLSVTADAVKDLDGVGLWNVFSKCKDSLAEGQRLDPTSSSATTPSSEKDMPLLISPSPSPISVQLEELSPSDNPLLLPPPLVTSIHSVPSTDTLCSARLNYPVAVGRIVFDHILPEKISLRRPHKPPVVHANVDISSPSPAPSATVPSVLYPSTPPNAAYPKVVIVNPTPHPTPPATPLSSHQYQNHGSNPINNHHLQALSSTRPAHLAPPTRSMAPQGNKFGEALGVISPSRQNLAPSAALSLLRASPKPIDDGTKVAGSVSQPKFFLNESPERGDSSPDRDSTVRQAIDGHIECDGGASSHGDSSAAGKSVGSDKTPSSVGSTKTSSVGSRNNVGQTKKAASVAAAAPARRKTGHGVAARLPRPTMNRMNSRFGQKKSKSSTNIAAIAPLAGPSQLAMTRTVSARGEARTGKAEETVSPKPVAAPAPTRPMLPRRATEKAPSTGKVAQTQQRRGIVVDNSSTEYETTDSEDESEWASEDVTPAEDKARKRKAKKRLEEERLKREEEEQAQKDKNMFAKLPRRSYTNLPQGVSAVGGLSSTGPGPRTRSVGLLSQLLNPDPQIFPVNHPYRTSSSTQDMTQFSRGSGLTLTRRSTAQPLATQVTAHAPSQNPDPSAGAGKYRPKGRPEGAEMDDDSGEEDENKLELSTSLAQQRLAALAGPGRRPKHQPRTGAHQLSQDTTARPGLTSVASAPIPLSHPYNLPAPAAPSTPRTTRRQMLATELSESLRRNLLWERQISKVGGGGKRRPGVLSAAGLKPLTSMDPPPPPTNSAVAGPSETDRPGGVKSGDEAIIDGNGSKEERRKKALARNKSWADDYHTAGW